MSIIMVTIVVIYSSQPHLSRQTVNHFWGGGGGGSTSFNVNSLVAPPCPLSSPLLLLLKPTINVFVSSGGTGRCHSREVPSVQESKQKLWFWFWAADHSPSAFSNITISGALTCLWILLLLCIFLQIYLLNHALKSRSVSDSAEKLWRTKRNDNWADSPEASKVSSLVLQLSHFQHKTHNQDTKNIPCGAVMWIKVSDNFAAIFGHVIPP